MRSHRDPVRWIAFLFLANFCLQRLALPGISIPVTVPLAVLWVAAALRWKVVELNQQRLVLWLLAGAVSALMIIPQLLLVQFPIISVNSWAFWMVIWLPMVVQFRDRSPEQYQRVLGTLGNIGIGLSALSVLFIGLQLVGVGYRDWVSDVVPAKFLVQEYAISYPVAYGVPIYKSNGWLALEPSFLSFTLGVCVVSAIIARMSTWKVLWIMLGLLATTAGSGIAIVIAFVFAAIIAGRFVLVRKFAVPMVGLAVIVASTSLGQPIASRIDELGQSRSSTSLRAIEPYLHLFPQWLSDPAAVFVGRGAGSSRWAISDLGIPGLLVPNVGKVFFDYGLIGGALLLAVMVAVYLRSPEPAFAAALAISMFTIQSASQPLVLCSLVAVTMFSPALPRRGRPDPRTSEPVVERVDGRILIPTAGTGAIR